MARIQIYPDVYEDVTNLVTISYNGSSGVVSTASNAVYNSKTRRLLILIRSSEGLSSYKTDTSGNVVRYGCVVAFAGHLFITADADGKPSMPIVSFRNGTNLSLGGILITSSGDLQVNFIGDTTASNGAPYQIYIEASVSAR